MNMYHSGALFKLILGITIAVVLYQYVNVFQQSALALSFAFLSFFLIIRSLSYFVFLGGYRLFSRRSLTQQCEKSYSLGLLTGMYAILNVAMIMMGNRNMFLGIIFAFVFVLFILIMAHGSSH